MPHATPALHVVDDRENAGYGPTPLSSARDDEISEVSMDGFSDAPFMRRPATPPPIEDAGPTKLFAKPPSDAPPPLDFADEHDTLP